MSRINHLRLGTLLALFIVTASVAALHQSTSAGSPVYPDLRTQSPYNLSISRERVGNSYHYLVRFSNQIRNHGGALEITANLSQSRDLYQNIYDRQSGGSVVVRKRINSDLIYHPTHNHFHFQGFATYELLKKNGAGEYGETAFSGSKTSYCIIDFQRWSSSGRSTSKYSSCNASKQGMSFGWADTYYASLPGQWIDLGSTRPADGDYAILSTADPGNKILESNDGNNSATVYFRIRNGQVTESGQDPFCSADPSSAKVGATVAVSCTRVLAGDQLEFRWGSSSGPVIGSATVSSENKGRVSFTVPEEAQGVHTIYVRNKTRSETYLASFKILPSLAISPTSGRNYVNVDFDLAGFNSGETVEVKFRTVSTYDVDVTTEVVNNDGSGQGSFAVPLSAYGEHRVTAYGKSSRTEATTTFLVTPSLVLSPGSGDAGSKVQPRLRGFKGSEKVEIRLGDGGPLLVTATVNTYGKLDVGNTYFEFRIPVSTAPGNQTIVATGLSSGAKAMVDFVVTGVSPASEPRTPTPSATPTIIPVGSPTEIVPTVTGTPTEAPTEVPTDLPTVVPTEVPTDIPTEVPTDIPTEVPTEVPTDEPEPEESPASG